MKIRDVAALILAVLLAGGLVAQAADFKAGVARVPITPEKPILLQAYPHIRTHHPSEGVMHELWAKALAIEDSKRGRVVIVTIEVAAVPRGISEVVAARVQKEFGLERARLVLNVSHTHSGPVLASNTTLNPSVAYDLSPEENEAIQEYSRTLPDKLVGVVGEALRNLAPADLSYGNGRMSFAVHRRVKTMVGVKMLPNPDGPTDPDVPVLKVTTPEGKLKAVLFGYACHPVVLMGTKDSPAPRYMFLLNGDYAGFAQIDLEKSNPGATALFVQLCGGDQNPEPRGSPEVAERHGATLASEVNRVLGANLQRVRGSIRAALQMTELGFVPHKRETFEARLKDRDALKVRHAKAMLQAYDRGSPERSYSYPVQAVAFGKDLTLLALGGEVVVEYALRAKKEFGAQGLIVAGYSNDVMAYIPSQHMLQEGGHEVDFAMFPYGHPGRWDDEIEERIFATIHRVMKQVGRTPVQQAR